MARGRPPACIHCGSSRSTLKGLRRTKRLGVRQIRRCKDCGRKFTPRHQKPVETKTDTQPEPALAEPIEQGLEGPRPADGP